MGQVSTSNNRLLSSEEGKWRLSEYSSAVLYLKPLRPGVFQHSEFSSDQRGAYMISSVTHCGTLGQQALIKAFGFQGFLDFRIVDKRLWSCTISEFFPLIFNGGKMHVAKKCDILTIFKS